jgi:predicted flap endonuclease-1-like 5' DNA nuclease
MNIDTNTIFIIVAVLAVLIVGFLLMRPRRQRIETRRDEGGEPYVASRDRPYMKPREGNGVTGEVAAATTDVAGEVLSVNAHAALSGAAGGSADELQLLKGVGPKFVARLQELGITRFAQLATLNETEAAHLDERMGPFRGRLARDRVIEQADYLSRGDIDGFEERFGRLGEPVR